jgi:hypothetical protein
MLAVATLVPPLLASAGPAGAGVAPSGQCRQHPTAGQFTGKATPDRGTGQSAAPAKVLQFMPQYYAEFVHVIPGPQDIRARLESWDNPPIEDQIYKSDKTFGLLNPDIPTFFRDIPLPVKCPQDIANPGSHAPAPKAHDSHAEGLRPSAEDP